MAFGIYANKSYAFSTQLELEKEVIEKLERFCIFMCTMYINDLKFHQDLFNFSFTDPELATAASKVLGRHGWYLMEQTVSFALWSDKLDNDEKSRLAAKLLTFQQTKPTKYKLGKPTFPRILPTNSLEDLLGPNSFMLWDILGLDYQWLEKSRDKWEEDGAYREAREFVKTLKVTNDVAERGVKLITDYIGILTKDDQKREWLLQGVEKSRKCFPDFRKTTLNK